MWGSKQREQAFLNANQPHTYIFPFVTFLSPLELLCLFIYTIMGPLLTQRPCFDWFI